MTCTLTRSYPHPSLVYFQMHAASLNPYAMAAADHRRPFKPSNPPSSFGAPGAMMGGGGAYMHHGMYQDDAMEE